MVLNPFPILLSFWALMGTDTRSDVFSVVPDAVTEVRRRGGGGKSQARKGS